MLNLVIVIFVIHLNIIYKYLSMFKLRQNQQSLNFYQLKTLHHFLKVTIQLLWVFSWHLINFIRMFFNHILINQKLNIKLRLLGLINHMLQIQAINQHKPFNPYYFHTYFFHIIILTFLKLLMVLLKLFLILYLS